MVSGVFLPVRENTEYIVLLRFEPCGHGSAAALVYGYFELDDITQYWELADTHRRRRKRLYFICENIIFMLESINYAHVCA